MRLHSRGGSGSLWGAASLWWVTSRTLPACNPVARERFLDANPRHSSDVCMIALEMLSIQHSDETSLAVTSVAVVIAWTMIRILTMSKARVVVVRTDVVVMIVISNNNNVNCEMNSSSDAVSKSTGRRYDIWQRCINQIGYHHTHQSVVESEYMSDTSGRITRKSRWWCKSQIVSRSAMDSEDLHIKHLEWIRGGGVVCISPTS